MEQELVIVSAVRTPIGKYGGTLKNINSGKLASIVIQEAINRAGISNEMVDEVIMGEVRQSSESSNVARVAALRAGIPDRVPAYTVNRLCASGMQAMVSGLHSIALNHSHIVVAGGVENLSNAPIYLRNGRFGDGIPFVVDSNTEVGQQPIELYGSELGMGKTAEIVAERFQISREDQDEFALQSQQRALDAINKNKFNDEIIPVQVVNKKETIHFQNDEHPRMTSLDALASLKPVFKQGGSVTAGNSCGRNDGAAALVIMKKETALSLGLTPLAQIVDWTAVGISPEIMGVGPIPAVRQILKRTRMELTDIDLIELNEAFASQALAVIRELGLSQEKVNIHGGGIALGHPLGATGARILVTLLHLLGQYQKEFGIATLCVGGGQGMAMLIKRLN